VAIAILGGTFDPVHNAHLAMAEAALKHLPVEKIVFMPTGKPGYRDAPHASGADRVAMLKLATGANPRFTIDERELAADATGYTVDTLKKFRGDKVYFLMGADQYEKLDTWREPDEVRKLAELVVFGRPGFSKIATTIPFESMQDSGTEIRARAARGADLSGMVPAAVAEYIVRNRLYR
jgi:nicotinate-nucleotide adenylyltransferase